MHMTVKAGISVAVSFSYLCSHSSEHDLYFQIYDLFLSWMQKDFMYLMLKIMLHWRLGQPTILRKVMTHTLAANFDMPAYSGETPLNQIEVMSPQQFERHMMAMHSDECSVLFQLLNWNSLTQDLDTIILACARQTFVDFLWGILQRFSIQLVNRLYLWYAWLPAGMCFQMRLFRVLLQWTILL